MRREGKEKEKVERERKWRDGAGRRKRGRDDKYTMHCSLQYKFHSRTKQSKLRFNTYCTVHNQESPGRQAWTRSVVFCVSTGHIAVPHFMLFLLHVSPKETVGVHESP